MGITFFTNAVLAAVVSLEEFDAVGMIGDEENVFTPAIVCVPASFA